MAHRHSIGSADRSLALDASLVPADLLRTKHDYRADVWRLARLAVKPLSIGGVVVLLAAGIGLEVHNRRKQIEVGLRDLQVANNEIAHDGFQPEKTTVGNGTGTATLILGRVGAAQCFVDGVNFGIVRDPAGAIVDTNSYTFRVAAEGQSNLVMVQDADELADVLGPTPCVPGSGGPHVEGLR